MATRKKLTTASKKNAPRSLAISSRGIKTGSDFAALMSSVMSDIIEERMSPGVGNAVCNAGSKLLKVVELQYRYGRKIEGTEERLLSLVTVDSTPTHQIQ